MLVKYLKVSMNVGLCSKKRNNYLYVDCSISPYNYSMALGNTIQMPLTLAIKFPDDSFLQYNCMSPQSTRYN